MGSLYLDILSGYNAWEESPLGTLAVTVGLLIKGITKGLTPIAVILLFIRLPLINGDPVESCVNTWIVLLVIPGMIFVLPLLKALRASRQYGW